MECFPSIKDNYSSSSQQIHVILASQDMLMSTFSTIFIRKRMLKYQKFKEWISKLIVLGITSSAVRHAYIYTNTKEILFQATINIRTFIHVELE